MLHGSGNVRSFLVSLLALLLLMLACSACVSLPLPARTSPPAATHDETSPAITSSPTAMFVATERDDASGALLSLQPDTGAVRWRRRIGVNTPALLYADGAVYVVGGLETLTGSRLYAVDASSGSIRWQIELKAVGLLWLQWAPGVLYLAGPTGGSVYAIRTSDGQLLWQRTLTATAGMAMLTASGGQLYALSLDDGVVYGLNAQTGALLWTYHSGFPVVKKMQVVGSRLYCSGQAEDGSQAALDALDSQSGRLLWEYREGKGSLSAFSFGAEQLALANTGGDVMLLRAQDGSLVWKAHPGTTGTLSIPLIAQGQVLVVNVAEHILYALNSRTGARSWQVATACTFVQQLLLSPSALYLVSDLDARVCALGLSARVWLWQTPVEPGSGPVSLLPLLSPSGQLYLLNPAAGLLSMVRSQDGSPGWQYNLGAFDDGIPAPVAFAS